MRTLEEKLLNDFQRDFPLVARPYAAIAQRTGAVEDEVISLLSALSADGRISRIGATFYAGCIGAATLAALAVPPARLAEVAARVSARAEVNHNYEREHRYNLWFVVTGPDARHVADTVAAIERDAGCGTVVPLPMGEPHYAVAIEAGKLVITGKTTKAGQEVEEQHRRHIKPLHVSPRKAGPELARIRADKPSGIFLTSRAFATGF